MCYFYLANCFRMSEQSCSTTRRHFDTNFFSFSYRPMLGATWLCLCFIMVNRVIGEEEVEMIPSGCCDWPSCYDTRTQVCHLTLIDLMIPLFKLCLDACQKVWIQCPSKLVLLSCYSRFLPKDLNTMAKSLCLQLFHHEVYVPLWRPACPMLPRRTAAPGLDSGEGDHWNWRTGGRISNT